MINVFKKTAKQNYPGSVASYNTRPGNEVGLFYNAPEPTRGKTVKQHVTHATTAPICDKISNGKQSYEKNITSFR